MGELGGGGGGGTCVGMMLCTFQQVAVEPVRSTSTIVRLACVKGRTFYGAMQE